MYFQGILRIINVNWHFKTMRGSTLVCLITKLEHPCDVPILPSSKGWEFYEKSTFTTYNFSGCTFEYSSIC